MSAGVALSHFRNIFLVGWKMTASLSRAQDLSEETECGIIKLTSQSAQTQSCAASDLLNLENSKINLQRKCRFPIMLINDRH